MGGLKTGRVPRAGRRSISRELASLTRHAPVPDDAWDDSVDLRAYPDIEIREIVRWRRAADKLNHFERWAIEVTKGLPPEDRLGNLRSILPGGLVGDHAMSHLEWRPELNPRREDHTGAHIDYRRSRAASQRDRRARLHRLLVAVLETPGGHKALNAAMKAEPEGDDDKLRLLAGVHDLDAFVDDVLEERNAWLTHPRWHRAVRDAVVRTLGLDEDDV